MVLPLIDALTRAACNEHYQRSLRDWRKRPRKRLLKPRSDSASHWKKAAARTDNSGYRNQIGPPPCQLNVQRGYIYLPRPRTTNRGPSICPRCYAWRWPSSRPDLRATAAALET